jgi:hypothetical protein
LVSWELPNGTQEKEELNKEREKSNWRSLVFNRTCLYVPKFVVFQQVLPYPFAWLLVN